MSDSVHEALESYHATAMRIKDERDAFLKGLQEISKLDPQSDACGPNAPTACTFGCLGCVARAAISKATGGRE